MTRTAAGGSEQGALRRAVGSLLVVGLEETALSGMERAWLRTVHPGGVILFRRNIADALQTRALLANATVLCAPHAFRCVDVEGGTVDRLRDALAPMPSAQAVATADRKRGGNSLARQQGELIGRGVRAFGFNTTLAPVLDLALPDSAVVMGTRSVGSTAAEVIAYASGFLSGLSSQGVAGCGKHFPGLGGGKRDSHFETPEIRRGWKKLWSEDLTPYRELGPALPMVMVNHAAYPDTQSGKLPATASPFWVTRVLRKRIGYSGLIFSDDMEMGGILKFMPMEEAAIAAVRAGMDTLEICHSPELILRAYESLLNEAERSNSFRTLILSRARDVACKRVAMFSAGVSRPLNAKQFQALRERILRFREKVLQLSGDEASAPYANKKTAPVVETA